MKDTKNLRSLEVAIGQIDPLKVVAILAACIVLFGPEYGIRGIHLFLIPTLYYAVDYLRCVTWNRASRATDDVVGGNR